MLRFITLSVALLIGKVSLLECSVDDTNYCTNMLKEPAVCQKNVDSDNFICMTLDEIDEEKMALYETNKPRLMSFVPAKKYWDAYCNFDPKS